LHTAWCVFLLVRKHGTEARPSIRTTTAALGMLTWMPGSPASGQLSYSSRHYWALLGSQYPTALGVTGLSVSYSYRCYWAYTALLQLWALLGSQYPTALGVTGLSVSYSSGRYWVLSILQLWALLGSQYPTALGVTGLSVSYSYRRYWSYTALLQLSALLGSQYPTALGVAGLSVSYSSRRYRVLLGKLWWKGGQWLPVPLSRFLNRCL